jgi:hypothetical protein
MSSWGQCYAHHFRRFFANFLPPKLAFFLPTNAMIQFFKTLTLFWAKNAYFSPFWAKIIFKLIPGWLEWGNLSYINGQKFT